MLCVPREALAPRPPGSLKRLSRCLYLRAPDLAARLHRSWGCIWSRVHANHLFALRLRGETKRELWCLDRGNIEPTLGRQHRREPHRSFSGWMGRPARKRCTSRGGGPPMTGARAMIGAEGDRGDPASATHLQEFCIASSRQIGKTRDRAPSPRARCDDAPTLHAGGRGGREARRRRRSSGRAVGAFLSSTAGSIPCDRKSLSGAATASALASKR